MDRSLEGGAREKNKLQPHAAKCFKLDFLFKNNDASVSATQNPASCSDIINSMVAPNEEKGKESGRMNSWLIPVERRDKRKRTGDMTTVHSTL